MEVNVFPPNSEKVFSSSLLFFERPFKTKLNGRLAILCTLIHRDVCTKIYRTSFCFLPPLMPFSFSSDLTSEEIFWIQFLDIF